MRLPGFHTAHSELADEARDSSVPEWQVKEVASVEVRELMCLQPTLVYNFCTACVQVCIIMFYHWAQA